MLILKKWFKTQISIYIRLGIGKRCYETVTGNYSLIICVCECTTISIKRYKDISTEHFIYAVRPQALNPLLLTQLVSSSIEL